MGFEHETGDRARTLAWILLHPVALEIYLFVSFLLMVWPVFDPEQVHFGISFRHSFCHFLFLVDKNFAGILLKPREHCLVLMDSFVLVLLLVLIPIFFHFSPAYWLSLLLYLYQLIQEGLHLYFV